jgi:hypothetical protein
LWRSEAERWAAYFPDNAVEEESIMARDLSVFLTPLAVATEPGLASVDPRLAELDSLGSHDRYDVAAGKVEALMAEGIYDIRPLSYYFYQTFREGGVGALGAIFDALHSILGQNLEAIGPANRRAEHFNKRLGWFFEKVTDSLEYHEKKGTPEWEVLRKGLAAEPLEQAIGGAERLGGLLAADTYAAAGQRLARLTGWLRRQLHALALSGEQPAEVTAPASTVQASAGPSPLVPTDPPGPGISPPSASRGDELPEKVELAVSHRFIELGRKLRAFEVLIEKKEFEKAALVADDLMHVVEHFDPREYFPELFARFGALFSKNIGQLAGHWEERSSPSWKALHQFYRVDLKGFISS